MGPIHSGISARAPRCRWLAWWVAGLIGWALMCPVLAAEDAPQTVIRIQLRWLHQFQFAGYYAALEKGFYRDEGLNVELVEGSPERQPVKEVLAGRAMYAEGNSEVLLARLQGQPLVALAAIFQHSPSVLLALRSSGIESPHDLIGKSVMLMDSRNDPDFLTMLLNEGISPDLVDVRPSSFDFSDLIEGRVDAFNSYLTNEPYLLRQRGIEYTVINPRNYRVDFYSDILFTHEDELRNYPARVAAVRRATLRGWRYAMDNPEEIIDLLKGRYQVAKSREHLRFEADAIRALMMPDLVEIGHMNAQRWNHMAETFVRAGVVEDTGKLEGFIYGEDKDRPLPGWVAATLFGGAILIVSVTLLAVHFFRINRRLQQAENEVRRANLALVEKLAEIEDLHERLQERAMRDALTGLYNRRYLDETLGRELARAKREGYPLCLALIDLDHFKQVNDTFGHLAGDEVLQHLGRLLRSRAREGDIPCRYGGEEFALVMAGMPLSAAWERAEEWREIFAESEIRHGQLKIRVSMSVGLAAYPDNAGTAEELMRRADEALYRAKDLGRNRVESAA
ncbi:MAG: GGDEF domain-containing protein [Rhodocyclaceae bacterium]|nr:GGDEF domain-containing protein [Rhodocyclaceae bacterium]